MIQIKLDDKVDKNGIIKDEHKYLKEFFLTLVKYNNREDIQKVIEKDGLVIFCMRMLFGRISSSQILNEYIERYGFEELENDKEWLKRLKTEKFNKQLKTNN